MVTLAESRISDNLIARVIRGSAFSLVGSERDYDPLMELIGDTHVVLLGQATHGTHEFYRERARITKRLIREKGFTVVAVEADWPDACRVNRYVQGRGSDTNAADALADFQRFPSWMWRNADVLDFVTWLRIHNENLGSNVPKTGFHGLDLYSLHTSMEAAITYLDKVDPVAAARARSQYACFDQIGDGEQVDSDANALGLSESRESEVIGQLVEIRRAAADHAERNGRIDEDDYFYAEQNARLVRDAEQYYRMMHRAEVSSWNLRAQHMADTLDSIVEYLGRTHPDLKVVVWAHNSHLGDAVATDMGARGESNVGQIVRDRYGRDTTLVGFTTYQGSVTAASSWGAPAERKRVRPAPRNSYEALFHDVGMERFLLTLRNNDQISRVLRDSRLEREIGVIYRPRTERASHYYHATLSDQFDAVIHFDRTRAVEPLASSPNWIGSEVPET